MLNPFAPYECQFTEDERKRMIGQTVSSIRKGKNYSQKEVASMLGISQATYSTYERGRTEPPAEVLVRLSFLFDCPVDVLVQRDRLARTNEDAQKQIDELKRQLQECEEQMAANGGDNPVAQAFLESMNALLRQTEQLNNSAAAAQSYEEPLNKG